MTSKQHPAAKQNRVTRYVCKFI